MFFVAIDVETANADVASICQIGIAKFENNVLVEEWVSYVDPQDYFDPMNISIHRINEDVIDGAPTLPELLEPLKYFLEGSICVCHTHFDRISIRKAFEKYQIEPLKVTWLDSARIARRAWNEFAWGGYGLANVCKKIGYQFQHHHALEDAKACGHIVLAAIRDSNLDLNGWLHRVEQSINPIESMSRPGNPEGALYGETIVFTGALAIPRRDAADMASKIGCSVALNVTKETTLLVVGNQDVAKLSGKVKSSKHLKAERLIQEGNQIRILKESDFLDLINSIKTPL